MGSISVKIDKQNLEKNTVKFLYTTTHNTNNRFVLLSTTDDNDNKTTIINNRKNKKTKTAYYTPIIKITKQEAMADAGATRHFFLPVTPVNNVQPEIKPITINIPDKSKLRSTHTYNL